MLGSPIVTFSQKLPRKIAKDGLCSLWVAGGTAAIDEVVPVTGTGRDGHAVFRQMCVWEGTQGHSGQRGTPSDLLFCCDVFLLPSIAVLADSPSTVLLESSFRVSP